MLRKQGGVPHKWGETCASVFPLRRAISQRVLCKRKGGNRASYPLPSVLDALPLAFASSTGGFPLCSCIDSVKISRRMHT